MLRNSIRRLGVLALLLAPTAVAVAAFFVWSPASGRPTRAAPTFTSEVLDALDAALERSAAGRWPAWEMRIERGELRFRVEAASEGGGRLRADCAALGALVREHVPGSPPWQAEITRAGAVVARCPEQPVRG